MQDSHWIKWLKHPEYVEFLMNYIPGHEESEIRAAFNEKFGIILAKGQIKNFKHKYNIKSGTHGGCFKKGQIPHNKGQRLSPELRAKIESTMFKKGQIPATYRKVGSERINVDGYTEVKVEDPKKWRLKQRVVWEDFYHEKLKSNEVVIFLDGNRQNFSIDNLFKMDRSSLVRFNQDHLYGDNKDISLSAAILASIKGRMSTIKNEKSVGNRIG